MKPKMLAILLLAGEMAFTTVAQAQWGYGMYGAAPSCPYQQGAAPGASDEDDQIAQLQNVKRDLKKEKRDDERKLKDLESKKDKYTGAINDSLQSSWADKVTDHLENGYNCNCAPAGPAPTVVGYEVIQEPPAEAPPTYIPPPAPEPEPVVVPVAPPRPARPNTDIFDVTKQTRSPASVGEISSAPPAATNVVAGNSYDAGWTGGGGGNGDGGGAMSMCGPDDEISHSKPWKAMCRNGGGVSKEICKMPYFLQSGAREKQNDCADAIQNYRKTTQEADKLRNKIKAYDDRIAQINIQIGDLKKDQADDRALEASCPTGDCVRPRHKADSSSSSNLMSTLLPLGVGILGGLGAEYLGYKANQANNTNLNKLGYPTQPYQAGSYGFPFFQAGIYGAVAGSQKSSFGCAGGIGGGGFQNGPYGMMSPYGMMNPYSNPYGMMNPMAYGNGMMGGGMYNPGMGPWGMSGMPGMGMGGMMPGMGMVGGMAMAGMPGYGGMAMAGMPGYGMAMPGMGFAMAGGMAIGGGLAMGGMPGYGMAMPGMGLAMGGGLAVSGGLAMGMPGYGMAMPGMGLAGMPSYGMAMPTLAGGLAMGSMMPTLAGGLATGLATSPLLYQQQMIAQQAAQSQAALSYQIQAANSEAAQLHTEQTLMQQYYSLMYQMNQVSSGASGLGGVSSGYSPLLSYSSVPTLGTNYGLGVNYGLTTSTGFTTSILGGSTIDSAIPGRSR